jgi:DNA-binding MarR family transcriptional regulator
MDDRELYHAMRALAHRMHMMSDGRAGQGRLLAILLENDGITQRDLQDMVSVRSGSLSEVLGKLEAAGLIERRPSAEDRRMARVFLTEPGAREARSCADRHAEATTCMFNCLTEREKEQLFELATRINEHLERTERTQPHGCDEARPEPHHRGDGRFGHGGRGFHG